MRNRPMGSTQFKEVRTKNIDSSASEEKQKKESKSQIWAFTTGKSLTSKTKKSSS